MFNSKVLFGLIVLASISASSEAFGIRSKRADYLRCKISEYVCKGWCRAAGHSDGRCNSEDECLCSEEKLEKYVCSDQVSDSTAHTLCAGWCQFKGLQTGDCNKDELVCECSEAELTGKHVKCVTDEICSMYCQFKHKKAGGSCQGEHKWDCVCTSDPSKNSISDDKAESETKSKNEKLTLLE